MTIQKQEIIEGMQPLYEQAAKLGHWLHCSYQDMWFSPDELRAAQESGRFMWGAVNWTVRDPKEQVSYLERQVERAQSDLAAFKRRIKP